MPRYSKASMTRLRECDQKLQFLFLEVIKRFDCSIVCGFRNAFDQNMAYRRGNSKLKFPESKHNKTPSKAIDVAPWIDGAISWNEKNCIYFAGYVMRVAEDLGIAIRWGGDWDNDKNTLDQRLNDYVHFELIEED